MSTTFDRPPGGRARSGDERLIALDVSRAVALIGVVTMNYHGMINYSGSWQPTNSLLDRMFDIRSGVLSTRFAAMFVVVAGIGVTLLTESARHSADRSNVIDARLRLVRRGVVLLVGGYFLDMSWPGTILFHYGVYFLLAAAIFRLRTRNLLALGVATIAATLGVSVWRRIRLLDGDVLSWLEPTEIASVQDLVARSFLGYTHPALPWMVFLIIGMVIGRHIVEFRRRSRFIGFVLAAVISATYLVSTIVRSFHVEDNALVHVLTSMRHDERGLAYIVSTASIAVLAFIIVSAIAERCRSNTIVVTLQRAGQLSLTLYLGHVFFYYALVEWLDLGVGPGLGAAITFALAYWVLAMSTGSWWHHRVGRGPAETLYRRLGG